MSTPVGARSKNGSTMNSAATALARTLGRGVGAATAAAPFGRGRGVGLAPPPRSRGRGGGSVPAATTAPASVPFSIDGCIGGGFPNSSASMEGFPLPPISSPSWFDSAGGDPSSPASWDKEVHPSGGFMSYFTNQPHNSHLVGAMSSPQQNIIDNSLQDNVRTEKRIMWTEEEDIRLMSTWIEHSTDSTCGADKSGGQYWGEVVDAYNKTTPPLRRRNVKQSKDRWHKINRWTDLFEYAYVKARRIFTSGYSDQMWIDAAHKFYVEDNKDKDPKLGPFVLMEVWKICREVSKWKTYNEGLRKARKRKSFHLEGDSEDKNDTFDEMPQRPMGQNPNPSFAEALRRNSAIKARPTHRQLKKDLINHIWQCYGNNEN